MSSFQISRSARADLKNIAVYTQKTWGVKQRRIYIKKLDTAFHFLADNPLVGDECNDIIVGLRKHPLKQHIIFYEIRNDAPFIVRVLHKSMDVESKLNNPY